MNKNNLTLEPKASETQSESALENQLLSQLQTLGYEFVVIKNEDELIANLKKQLEKHNRLALTKNNNCAVFSNNEFKQVMNILAKGSIFEKAKNLRKKQYITRDNGEQLYFEFLNIEHWCQNQFQVANQITIKAEYENRYDVTILINGLPVVQIELKKRGLEIKEAFNQIVRYQTHSFDKNSALFQYLQLFVVSNGVNTKYFANNSRKDLSFEQTFYWTDKDNNRLTNILNGFTANFFEPCHLAKMICKYIVLNETEKRLMVLRPYQFYAVEVLVNKVMHERSNGYIWHTTGSGKTLTSFKASQILTHLPKVKKVVFVVDRKDLDTQTSKEFNSFSKNSIDGTDNTKILVEQFCNDNTKLIVTTIQKLNVAISKNKYLTEMQALKHERIVFIFDECHRSQFGETHKRIKNFFENMQMFGFTGTPIFADNSVKNNLGTRTTKELFDEPLHKYVINDAIRDENVLSFSVEYIGIYKRKDSANNIDIKVENIDTAELIQSPERLTKIVDYIIANHDKKTHHRDFTAMFCVESVDTLIKYYDIFAKKKLEKQHNLKIATIFSYSANEPNPDNANAGHIDDEFSAESTNESLTETQLYKREKLELCIKDYNQMFGTKFTSKDSDSFYSYYNNIAERVKRKEVDILLVVNMFLTGFDSKYLNTLYVDKNLKYHGLIQAYSRTNRVLNAIKSQGNIVVFRNLKAATDEAITLFSNKDAIETIIMQPYDNYVAEFNKAVEELLVIAPTVDSVNDLITEDDELAFIKAFRKLMRIKNVMIVFADFDWEDLAITAQQFEDYKSKYYDLYEKAKAKPDKTSIINDVDFEIELIHRDDINVAYIIALLIKLKAKNSDTALEQKTPKETSQIEKEINNLLNSEIQLRSKRELIEKFIDDNLPKISASNNIEQEFVSFWQTEKQAAFNKLISEEKLSEERTNKLIESYLFTERKPMSDEIINLLENNTLKLMQRREVSDRILAKFLDFVDTYIMGMND